MIQYIISEKKPELKYFKLPAAMLFICISAYYIFIFAHIGYAENQSKEYIRKQMINNKTEIVIPVLPYSEYLHESNAKKIGIYYYYKKPWDIKFRYITYKTWFSNYYKLLKSNE
jgi:hypothetical protein